MADRFELIDEGKTYIVYVQETMRHKCAFRAHPEHVADWWNSGGVRREIQPSEVTPEHVYAWITQSGDAGSSLQDVLDGSLDSEGMGNHLVLYCEEAR